MSIVRTWTWQLLQRKDYLMEDIFQIYNETVGTSTPLASYQKALKRLLTAGEPCYLIVDGLDECDMEARLPLRNVLQEVVNYAKVLVVSRWELWIECGLPLGAMTTKIEVGPEQTSNDIRRWIPSQVGMLGCEQKEAALITQRMTDGAKGMFLWAQLMMKHLLQQATLNDILSALDEMPDGMECLYDRLLQRFHSLPLARFKVAQRLLQWTFSATRPLSIPELEIALGVTPGSEYQEHGNTVPNLRTFVRDSCGPLL